ncbi:capsular biosynthesis protein [Tumebacillus algifaecis]|uniref:Capsular biosynthesis protein n=1 Tax=Tumebacillus algifaecis TaxID=1214604 RepID=A0A223D3N6_9BACL|nr:CapA family protein [Tumebacillus algifaecis]ASS76160.1 capsular biosynthesis protein [Tumebacillus algifaecis]
MYVKKVWLTALSVALLVGVSGCSAGNGAPNPNAQIQTPNAVNSPPKEEAKAVTTQATVAAIGDILIHSSLYKDAQTANGGYDFRYQFELVKPYLLKPDLAIANQETMIGGVEVGLSDYPMFNSPYEVGDALKDAGIDVVSIANNHSLDAGEKGIRSAIKHWNELGIPYVGVYESAEDQAKIRVVEKNGIKFAILSYTYGTNGIPVPEGKDYLINLIDPVKMKAAVREAKGMADVVIMNLHTGNEYQRLPSDEQKELVREMTKEGVDIVLGHHPHVLQPVEWIDNGDGRKSFVIYSLGNFISGQDEIYREIGGILELEVEKVTKGDEKTITLKNPAFLPVWTHKRNWRQYKVIPLADVTPQQLPKSKELYEEINAHMKQWVPELKNTMPK